MHKHTAQEKDLLAQTGDETEYLVLSNLIYWQPRARHTRGGVLWVIQTAKEMQEYGVRRQEDTIWRAIRRLQKRGLIEKERHPHPHGDPRHSVNWLRVPGLELRVKKEPKIPPQTGTQSHPEPGFNPSSSIHTSTTVLSQTPANAGDPAQQAGEEREVNPKPNGLDFEEKHPGKDMKIPSSVSVSSEIGTILTRIADKGFDEPDPSKPLTSGRAFDFLRWASWKHDPKGPVLESTTRQKALMGYFLKKARTRELTDDQIRICIVKIVERFPEFVRSCKELDGFVVRQKRLSPWLLNDRAEHVIHFGLTAAVNAQKKKGASTCSGYTAEEIDAAYAALEEERHIALLELQEAAKAKASGYLDEIDEDGAVGSVGAADEQKGD